MNVMESGLNSECQQNENRCGNHKLIPISYLWPLACQTPGGGWGRLYGDWGLESALPTGRPVGVYVGRCRFIYIALHVIGVLETQPFFKCIIPTFTVYMLYSYKYILYSYTVYTVQL